MGYPQLLDHHLNLCTTIKYKKSANTALCAFDTKPYLTILCLKVTTELYNQLVNSFHMSSYVFSPSRADIYMHIYYILEHKQFQESMN